MSQHFPRLSDRHLLLLPHLINIIPDTSIDTIVASQPSSVNCCGLESDPVISLEPADGRFLLVGAAYIRSYFDAMPDSETCSLHTADSWREQSLTRQTRPSRPWDMIQDRTAEEQVHLNLAVETEHFETAMPGFSMNFTY